MARSSTRKRPSSAAAPEGINPKAACPCGSGRRYKHCHGSGYAPPATRPFEGLPGEADWVALRELVPGATATLRTTRSGEHTSELQSRQYPACRLLLGKKFPR